MADDGRRGGAAGGPGVVGARRGSPVNSPRPASPTRCWRARCGWREALEGGATALVGVWQRAPLQAIARLHALAAADLVDDDRLGRPRPDAGRRAVASSCLVDIVTGGTRVPAPVLAAVAHGELLTLAPFGVADGLVARAVSRLVTIASGLGPARSRRAGGLLDAAVRRLPRRRTRVRLGHTRRAYGVVDH